MQGSDRTWTQQTPDGLPTGQHAQGRGRTAQRELWSELLGRWRPRAVILLFRTHRPSGSWPVRACIDFGRWTLPLEATSLWERWKRPPPLPRPQKIKSKLTHLTLGGKNKYLKTGPGKASMGSIAHSSYVSPLFPPRERERKRHGNTHRVQNTGVTPPSEKQTLNQTQP